MKHQCNKYIFFLILFLKINAYSQDTTYVYYDKSWKETTKEKSNYYRKAYKSSKGLWVANDYYNNDTIQMKGIYKNKKYKTKHGKFSYYYKNGNLKSQGEISKDKCNNDWVYYYKTKTLRSKGRYKKGKKVGEWKWYYSNGIISSEENYKRDKLIDYTFFDKKGKKLIGNFKYKTTQEFPGGMKKLNNFIIKNFKTPKDLTTPLTKFHVAFTIGTTGDIEEIEVEEEIDAVIETEIFKVFDKMPNWTIGKIHNIPYRARYKLPVKLKVK